MNWNGNGYELKRNKIGVEIEWIEIGNPWVLSGSFLRVEKGKKKNE